MITKSLNELIAAIDVGSNYLRMIIAEIDKQGDIKVLENVIKSTENGKDTFISGRISISTINETCATLRGFVHLMSDYNVKYYKAVSTSGIREAENKQYVLEKIRLRVGLDVQSITSAEERFFMLKAIRKHFFKSNLKILKSALIINVTSGGLEVLIYEKDELKFAGYEKLGSLRLKENLSDLEKKTLDFSKVMEQHIESKIYSLKDIIVKYKTEYFVGLGGELKTIIKMVKNRQKLRDKNFNNDYITKENFLELYNEIKNINNDQIQFTYNLSKKETELLLPSISIFYCFFKITNTDGIYVPKISLWQGVLYNLADELMDMPGRKESFNDIISSVWYIGEKYGINKQHAAFVEKISLSIFDQTHKLHKLGNRERMYLQIASILHDSGNIINNTHHHIHSYNIIRNQSILGFSDEEISLIANIARYHSYEIPMKSHNNYQILGDKSKIIVSTLSAILKLAESLDSSHLQKIKKLKLTLAGETLLFNLNAEDEIILEEWNFTKNVDFFEEVVGVKPII
ncbi:exopolyphosphatase [Clostridium sp. WILCCON 0269]|uniref:Exopolyphosphatase n=1 Tax=Candidatus Clostridium eludens TaxID=3381663 RepID=A0ABW8SMB3_9CLOT